MQNKHTSKEVKLVAKEIRNLTKVVSIIGEAMFDNRKMELKNNGEKFESLVKKEKEKHNHSKWRLGNCT